MFSFDELNNRVSLRDTKIDVGGYFSLVDSVAMMFREIGDGIELGRHLGWRRRGWDVWLYWDAGCRTHKTEQI